MLLSYAAYSTLTLRIARFSCAHSGQVQRTGEQKQRMGTRTHKCGCPFLVNARGIDGVCVKFTTFKDEHIGHELKPPTENIIESLRQLTPEMWSCLVENCAAAVSTPSIRLLFMAVSL
jgi:hypothetical protein